MVRTFRERRLVEKPQQHRMEAVFSVSFVSCKETNSAVEQKYIAA